MERVDMKSRSLLIALAFALGGSLGATANDAVAIAVRVTKRVPIQTLDKEGHPSEVGMSTPGMSMIFVKADGDQIILKGPGNDEYELSMAATDYVPSGPALTAPVTNSSPSAVTPAAPAATSPAAANSPPPAQGTSNEEAEMRQKLNTAFGIPLFGEDHFWDESVDSVAKRLNCGLESKGADEVVFQSDDYGSFPGNPGIAFDCNAYSMCIEGREGKPTYFTMMFSNVWDFPEAYNHGLSPDDVIAKVNKGISLKISTDEQTISDKLTAVLGPSSERDGGKSSDTHRQIYRWNWKDISFLLTYREGAYLYLEMMPVAEADRIASGQAPDRSHLADTLTKRITRKDNGDVLLTGLPIGLYLSGSSGLVSAQWQRCFRYMGIPNDCHIVGVLGHHEIRMTPYIASKVREGINEYLAAYNCHVEDDHRKLTIEHIAEYIDQGVPIMWNASMSGADQIEMSNHSKKRAVATDLSAYTAEAAGDDTEREKDTSPAAASDDVTTGYMIVGYNQTTHEFAIDAPGEPLWWVTIRGGNRIAPNELQCLKWDDQ